MILFNPSMETEKLAVIGLVIIIVAGLSTYLILNENILDNFKGDEIDADGVIGTGDCADVNYVGRFQVNNTVFDTSYEDIANESGIYNELRTYEPLKIFVNPNGDLIVPEDYQEYTSNMLPGFINGLIGMEEGETKTITLPPEEAYGIWNETFAKENGISPSPLESEFTSVFTEPIESFSSLFPDVAVEEDVIFDYGAIGFGKEGVFNATITNVSDGNLTYKLTPENGTTFFFSYFNMNVTFTIINDTLISMKQNAEVGITFSMPTYYGTYIHYKVVAVNETHAEYAVNIEAPELHFIDQTLIFDLTVEKVYNTSDQLES